MTSERSLSFNNISDMGHCMEDMVTPAGVLLGCSSTGEHDINMNRDKSRDADYKIDN